MEIIRMHEKEGFVNPRGVTVKELYNVPATKIMNLNLNPGDHVPHHEVPVHVFFYVVEGTGTIQIGEEKQVVKEKEIIPCPAGVTMALWADRDVPFSVLNVKSPRY